MLNEHAKVGIAQTVFYAPALNLVLYLNFRHSFKRDNAWLFLLIFSCFRLAGGIVVIVLNHYPNSIGLIIAASILLGVGVPPLLIATMRLLGTACAVGFEETPFLTKAISLSRFLFLLALGFIIAGGSLEGQSGTVSIGQTLLKVGYIIMAVFLAIIVFFHVLLWTNSTKFGATGRTILRGTTAAIPFLIIRITYAFLSVFHPSDRNWEPLYGSVGAFVGMALVPEYIVLAVYVFVGIGIPSSRLARRQRVRTGEEGAQTSAAPNETAGPRLKSQK